MEKLIELLNESVVFDTIFENEYQVKFRATKIISKEFGFIKWLVDNNKIDFNFVERVGSGDFIYDIDSPYYYSCTCEDLKEYNEVDRVLMLLAIQDEPIEFLISILK